MHAIAIIRTFDDITELETQLVALIPVNDSRLKPRRTVLYVSLAVGIVLLIAGLLLFFLVPRNISIDSKRLEYVPDIESLKYDEKQMQLKWPVSCSKCVLQNHFATADASTHYQRQLLRHSSHRRQCERVLSISTFA